ncbi:hypothetical protein TSOC_004973 [Tetrabaena socialis]|uniref:Uncharacterized protein n=1 Tax=Tetrabaena socialis TaxID=47790 RepID=A0A2J8A7D6_9CHLO|nr:hypothetical protein TSOC_004973 [Tetrabaena socialis]|eukprot:PNH08444.1 hypothetical protein TSOC_004973 [Tetrabaena socialis]
MGLGQPPPQAQPHACEEAPLRLLPSPPAPSSPPAMASRRGALLLGVVGLAACLSPLQLRALAAEGITTVFVAGSTGNTGRRVVAQLRQAGFAVRAGVRVRGAWGLRAWEVAGLPAGLRGRVAGGRVGACGEGAWGGRGRGRPRLGMAVWV